MSTTPTPSAGDDGVGGLLDMAEAMLRLAGEPTSQSDRLIAAQTAAMIGLGRALQQNRTGVRFGPEQPAFPQVPNPTFNASKVPPLIVTHGKNYGHTPYDLWQVMRDLVAAQPDWEQNKIKAIKEWRTQTQMGLKEAKDCIDTSASVAFYGWWR